MGIIALNFDHIVLLHFIHFETIKVLITRSVSVDPKSKAVDVILRLFLRYPFAVIDLITFLTGTFCRVTLLTTNFSCHELEWTSMHSSIWVRSFSLRTGLYSSECFK